MMGRIGSFAVLLAVGYLTIVEAKVHFFDRCGETIWVNDYDYYTVEIDGSDWINSVEECTVTFEALESYEDLYYKMDDMDIEDQDIKLILDSSFSGLFYTNEATYQKGDDPGQRKKRTNTMLRVKVTRDTNSRSKDIDVKFYVFNNEYTAVSTGGIIGIVFGCIGFVVVVSVVIAVVCAAKRSRAARGQVVRQPNQIQATAVTMATYPAPGSYPPNTALFAPNGYQLPPAQGYAYPSQTQYPVQAVAAYPGQGTGVAGNMQTPPTNVALLPGAPPADAPSYPPPKYVEKAM